MRNFRNYTVWQNGIAFVKMIYKFSQFLPNDEKYGLISQIKRASVSIPSNIAEGCSRNSDKEFKRFPEIAIGSAFELETQLIVIKELEFANEEETNNLLTVLNDLQKKLNSLIQKIINS